MLLESRHSTLTSNQSKKTTMKNFFLMLLTLTISLLCFSAQAQRFGTGKNQDNSFRTLNCDLVSYTLAAGVDTIKLRPSAFETHVRCVTTLSDSVAVQVASVSNSRIGDKVYCSFRSDGNTRRVKLVGSPSLVTGSATTISLAANKSLTLLLYYDGVRWVELSRFVQP